MSCFLALDSETNGNSQVFLAAIAGYVPSAMVHSIATFMDSCYIARHNAITAPALEHFQECVEEFHLLWNIFIKAGVQDSISLPHQHALKHFYHAIQLFSSPNGLCSSIMESKHIKVVKKPWRRSSQYQALIQMLQTIVRMEKIMVLCQVFSDRGILVGTTASYMVSIKVQQDQSSTNTSNIASEADGEKEDDGGPVAGDPTNTLFIVNLVTKFGASISIIAL
jgi:hypothetical protein